MDGCELDNRSYKTEVMGGVYRRDHWKKIKELRMRKLQNVTIMDS
jgi:hypothetical protein